jgi:hypothetical protein
MPPPADRSPSSSLTVLAGPSRGARLYLDPAVPEILIGSSPGCALLLAQPGIGAVHVRVRAEAGGFVAHDAGDPRGVFVNDQRVAGAQRLADLDMLWLGPPSDEESVPLQCRLVASATPVEEFVVEGEAAPLDVVEEFLVEDGSLPTPALAPEPAAVAPEDDVFFLEEPEPPLSQPAPPPRPAATPRPVPVPPPPSSPPASAMPRPAVSVPAPVTLTAPKPAGPAHAPPAAAAKPTTPAVPPPASAAAPAKPPAAPGGAPAASAARPAPPAARPATPASAAAPRPSAPAAPPVAGAKAAADQAVAAPGSRPERPARVPAARPERPVRPSAPQPSPRRASVAITPVVRNAALGLGGLVVVAALALVAWRLLSAPRISGIAPARVAPGQTLVISGARFGREPAANAVMLGDKTCRVLKAASDRLEVEIPELTLRPGSDVTLALLVEVSGRRAGPVNLAVFPAPRVHGLSPDVALPGDEVVLAGTGFAPGAQVRFGSVVAEILEVTPGTIKVRVPAIEGGPGTSAPVLVSVGNDGSNAAPFLVGRLPLIAKVEPARARPGDVVMLAGRGFQASPQDNLVRIGGVHALLLSASPSELSVVVPRLPEGDAPIELKVRGREEAGAATLELLPLPTPVDFHFVAEPLDDAFGHDHAVLATELGPAFVLSRSGGRSAAERALEAQRRLNAAAVPLKAAREADIEVRGIATAPVLALVGKPEALVEIASEDAAAFDEDWTKTGGRGGPVTRGRLAVWWGALARDLVLLLVRSEAPHFAADLAAEGRALGDVYQAGRKVGGFGLARQVVTDLKPQARDALRTLALRVPASVTEPTTGAAAAGGSAAPVAAFRLDGTWNGWENVGGSRQGIGLAFAGRAGSYAPARSAGTLPVLDVEQPAKGVVRFKLKIRGGVRHYQGRWDGEKLAGTISGDASGRGDLGNFELVKEP